MRVIEEHRLEIEFLENKDFYIPPVINPRWIPKEGERFRFISAIEGGKEIVKIFEIIEISHELHDAAIIGEQVIVAKVKEIK